MSRRPARSTLLPYATPFRSRARSGILENSTAAGSSDSGCLREAPLGVPVVPDVRMTTRPFSAGGRSEEHTSELQSRQYLVCRPLLVKKTLTFVKPITYTSVH